METLEPRQVMSADSLGGALDHHTLPDADFWYDVRDFDDIEQNLDGIEQMLSNANNLTGLTQARTNYGFTGIGQTVAVIDSGIAWNHPALGGGFGSNYRVVGGWDFTEENDANPYDDGPEGSHGTHVAGIIGSTHTTHTGVAPGVDLVALRVFNDAGEGYFSWVEKALQWVYTNRNAFENPITAVNLSLGTSWNATTVPSWSTLEDEFAALKSVGIFIAVSAGNSYTTYDAPGLSYPAASPHVVPVMSVDDDGLMSFYSQRHTSAIAAPGRTIMSTVPDYAGNHNGVTDDFASKSGTSMAAPYVAGASVLIRQAMQFVGMTNITQTTIFNHMLATANTFYDSVTATNYKRLNIGNAIDALIPNDEYGSTIATAYNMGTVSSNTQLAGMINTLTDSDYFRFTAGITGTIRFTATMSHGQAANWLASGLNGWTSGTGGQTYNINVVAGQSYTLGLSAAGLSNFTLNVAAEASLSFVDWGSIAQKSINNVNQSGEKLYRVQTSQAGYLTAEASYSGGSITIDWLNASMQQVATGDQRIDVMATGGQYYYLRVTGTNSDIDFRLTNLVSVSGSTATVNGTSLADTFDFSTSSEHVAKVNGVEYKFNKASVSTINFNGASGSDSIIIVGSAGSEAATINVGSATVVGSGFTVGASSIENITVYSGGGNDSVTMHGSNGDDLYSVWADRARMSGSGFFNEARHFNTTLAIAQGGSNDRAYLYDTAGDDTYTAWADRATMTYGNATHEVRGFNRTFGYATTGNDRAFLHDTTGNDTFSAWWDRAVMFGAGYNNETTGFKSTTAYASGGFDQAFLYDSAGDDRYYAWADRVRMTGHNFRNEAHGFDNTFGTASVGNDRADLYDSAGDDTYTAWWNRVRMAGSGFVNEATGFDRTKGHATAGGNNSATFYDSPERDVFAAWPDHACMYGESYFNDSIGFNSVVGYAGENYDKASFYDSAGDDVYTAWWNRILMVGNGFRNEAHGFERTMGRGARGNDKATLYDSPGDDVFSSWPTHAVLYGTYGGGFFNDTWLFPSVVAHASSGYDLASFYDSEGNDTFTAWWNRALMKGAGYSNDARGFDRAVGRSSTGNDKAVLYDSGANDSVHAMAWGAYMTDYAKYNNEARGFDFIEARRTEGGIDRAFLSTIDYIFELIGGWSA